MVGAFDGAVYITMALHKVAQAAAARRENVAFLLMAKIIIVVIIIASAAKSAALLYAALSAREYPYINVAGKTGVRHLRRLSQKRRASSRRPCY